MSRRRLSAATLVGLEELAEAPAATDRDVGASVRRLTLDGDQLVVSLPLTSIRPNPHQPRRAFSEQSLRELADSIAEHGRVLQPILVRPAEPSAPGDAAGFELVAGERRWRASKLAGLQTIRAIVDGVDNALSAEMALTENMAREDLTTMEAARGCEALRSAFGLSYAQIARRVGRDRTAISHLTRLLQLPDRAQALIEEGRLSAGHGSILLRLEDHDARRVLAILCADGGWSVRELERHVDARNAAPRRRAVVSPGRSTRCAADAEREPRADLRCDRRAHRPTPARQLPHRPGLRKLRRARRHRRADARPAERRRRGRRR